jgi:hypothetical protein
MRENLTVRTPLRHGSRFVAPCNFGCRGGRGEQHGVELVVYTTMPNGSAHAHSAPVAADERLELVAYVVNPALSMPLVIAPAQREWMEATDARFANRCLPLLMANQSGWLVLSAHTVRAVWLGGTGLDGMKVEHLSGGQPYPASRHFGHGILTFSLPYLFRTSPGYNLLVRGPANRPKDGASALEGVVETDWCPATFTMNWQLTRPNVPVVFEEGEPIAMLVPQRRGELESVEPTLRALAADREELKRYQEWARSRADFLSELRRPGSRAIEKKWQKDYFQGSDSGSKIEQHQTKLQLRPFETAGGPVASAPSLPKAGAPAPSAPAATPLRARDGESSVREVIEIDEFVDAETCARLVAMHKRFGSLTTTSDNGLYLPLAKDGDPEGFTLAADVVRRVRDVIGEHFDIGVGCDLALLCAWTEGGFRHTLHAGSVKVVCPRHGEDAEHLVHVGCSCDDAQLLPNHTPWRKFSAQLWLSSEHSGGRVVLGAGPHVFGMAYRKEIEPSRGRLVITPSNEHHFKYANLVESGVCYSLDVWFTDDPAHVSAEFA